MLAEINRQASELVAIAILHTRRRDEKPGEFLKKWMKSFPLIKKMKSKHFQYR